ncbi:hypothetical protein ACLI08_01925 [Flavobacterium sp. RNTU_13]|uniref:hypothetical protein n=1 Tax=Flavobacterium sp. RNTU_13 TaxID=3375145 RepID=UPI00398679BF
MKALPDKTKQFFVFIAKILVVGGAFYFIYNRLSDGSQFNPERLSDAINRKGATLIIAAILFLTVMNRFLEVLKWQALSGMLRPISLGKSAAQVLAAVTAAIFTPNGLGEYAAKAFYYKKEEAGQVVFLNLICNGVQMIIAVVAGLSGLVVFNFMYNILPSSLLFLILAAIGVLVAVVFASRKITIKGYSIQRLIEKIQELPKTVHRRNMVYALLRYLCIVLQHYLLFILFNVAVPAYIMLPAIAGIYFLGSSLPNFTFIDFAVRGSVAVFFFGKIGVDEWIVVLAATLQWMLNIVLPVIAGSYFVLTFKRKF